MRARARDICAVYDKLFGAISSMASANEDDPSHIDGEAEADAREFLALLMSFEVPPPKVFSHGGDAVTFTWNSNGWRRYVTPMDGCATLYEPGTQPERNIFDRSYDLNDQTMLLRLMRILADE